MKDPARILIAEDHPVVRRGLCKVISQEPDLTVCGEADCERDALALVATVSPDLVIVDLALREGDGIDLIKAIRYRSSTLPILVLTANQQVLYAERALRAGAQGFLQKSDAGDRIILAIRRLLAGETFVSEAVSDLLLQRLIAGGDEETDPVSRLSDRELHVFRLIGSGAASKQIADDVGVSVKTVEAYRARIREKLGLEDGRRLVQYAIRWVVERS